jgi:hypothetical protein
LFKRILSALVETKAGEWIWKGLAIVGTGAIVVYAWLKAAGMVTAILVGCGAGLMVAFAMVLWRAHAFYKREAPIDESNVDQALQKWSVDMGWSFRKIDIPNAHFCAEVVHPRQSERRVLVARFKNRPRYIRFQSHVPIPDDVQGRLVFAPDGAERIISQMKVALARAGLWYQGLSIPLSKLIVEHWIPVTRDLTEWEYIAAKDKLAAGIVEILEILKVGLRDLRDEEPTPKVEQ